MEESGLHSLNSVKNEELTLYLEAGAKNKGPVIELSGLCRYRLACVRLFSGLQNKTDPLGDHPGYCLSPAQKYHP